MGEACAHRVWILVEPRLSAFKDVLVHPSLDRALRARRALRFEWTGFASVGPIVAQLLAVFLVGRKQVLAAVLGFPCQGHNQLPISLLLSNISRDL